MPHGIIKSFKTNLPAYAVIALGQIQAFAIQYVFTKVGEILEELRNQCPPPATLARLTNIVNNTRRIISDLEKQISRVERIATYLDPVLLGAQIYVEIQKHRIDFLSTPVTGPAGTPTFARTSGEINSMTSRLKRFEELIDTVEEAQFAIKSATTTAKGIFVPILATLNVIDSLIQRCASNEGLTEEERAVLLDSIQDKTQELYRLGIEYRSQSGRVYTIKIINDPSSPAIAPKRQAIAQDFRGITVLTGPSSFASNPEVLIEELKFRIDNQLP